jgi:predicted O-linked N-acetylglucosamine transferase (SPINDLY family)
MAMAKASEPLGAELVELAASKILQAALEHHQAGRLPQAEALYRKILRVEPKHPDALHFLGVIAQQGGKGEIAVELMTKAIGANPSNPIYHSNLGTVLQKQGKLSEAANSYRKALSLKPDYADAHCNLGRVLQEQGRLHEAAVSYNKALLFKPDFAEAYSDLGTVLQEQGQLNEAVVCYNKALLFKPNFAVAYSNLIYLHAFAHDISPEALCTFATGWEHIVLDESERIAARNRTFTCLPRAGRRLKLGIVSAEIGPNHPVLEFLQPFLENLNRSRFSLTLYPTVIRSGPRVTRLKQLAEEVRPLGGISDSNAANQIRHDGMDILIDTTGHTSDCRLGMFAHRAAPVQCTYIGFWATTGITEMDWYISDEYFPLVYDKHFSEGLWRLGRLSVSYNGDTSLPESRWTPSCDGTVWLGSLNRYSKIREQSLGLWAKVMNAIPESKLLLEDHTVFDQETHKRIREKLSLHGIGSERIEFWPFVPGHERHMVLHDRLDIALDTIPFNGGTTTCDALWMGVPLVALEGNWSGGRMASTFLRALGRPEWIAHDEAEYVNIVAALARDVEVRKLLRATQRTLMAGGPLCDSRGMAKSLEDAFESMFDRWWVKHI